MQSSRLYQGMRILRSTIEQGEAQGEGIQKVHEAPLFIKEICLSEEEDYKSQIKKDINRPCVLSKDYPIRVKFYTIESSNGEADKRILLINVHQIASDGWSRDIFQRELLAYYEAYLINKDTDFSLPPLEIQYKDYAVWQRSYLTGEILEDQLGYWKKKLSVYRTLELPTDYVRPKQIVYHGSHLEFRLDRDLSQKLRALAKRSGSTLQSVMLGSMGILLGKYTGQDDIVIGSPIANRHHG